MRFFTSALVAVASLASYAVAQGSSTTLNPISFPSLGDTVEAGEKITITWKPDSEGTVTLALRKGNENNLVVVETIASEIKNSGTFTWTPKEALAAGEDYAIEIRIDESGDYNFSPKFTLDSEGEGLTTTTSAPTTRTTSTSTTETESTETDSTTTTGTTSTRTSTSARPTATGDDDDEDDKDDAPDTSDAGRAVSPLALVFCVAMAVVYFN